MKRRGLSLLEIVVSISLLALLITLVLELVPGSLFSIQRGQSKVLAENQAQSDLEAEAALGFATFSVGTQVALADVTLDGKVYHRKLQALAAGTEDPSHLKCLRVTVSWDERGMQRQSVRERWILKSID